MRLAFAVLAVFATVACAPSKPGSSSGSRPTNVTEYVTVGPAPASGSQAQQGGQDSGGGDPYAIQFIQIIKFLASKQSREAFLQLSIDLEKITNKITEIELSLEGKKPLLSFPEGLTTTCFDVPKLGCVEDGKIRIAREGWKSATLAEKIQVASMEILLLAGEKNRYALASKASAVLAKSLVLTDGNIAFPTSTDRAREHLLKMLSKKDSKVRKALIVERACADLFAPCTAEDVPLERFDYKFTDSDILSVTHLGYGSSIYPCKFDECMDEGEDSETSNFLVVVQTGNRGRWDSVPNASVLELTFERFTRNDNGKMRSLQRLKFFER